MQTAKLAKPGSHINLLSIAIRIADHWSVPSIEDDFKAAESLHRNMYIGIPRAGRFCQLATNECGAW